MEDLAHSAALGCDPLPQDTVSWPLRRCLHSVHLCWPLCSPACWQTLHIHVAHIPFGEACLSPARRCGVWRGPSSV